MIESGYSTAADVVRRDLDAICDGLADELGDLGGARLLIIGGAGFLGHYLVQAAAHANARLAEPIQIDVYDNYIRGVPAWLERCGDDPNVTLRRHDVGWSWRSLDRVPCQRHRVGPRRRRDPLGAHGVDRLVGTTSDDARIHLEVIPITVPSLSLRYFVVLFEEANDTLDQPTPALYAKPAAAGAETEGEQEIARVKQELAATKAYLQSVIEAKDVTNEELKAANEEVISSNEELQSTNEELETAKEELQATNEELETVNEELESRIHTTIQLNDELTNLITCVRIPIVIVGADPEGAELRQQQCFSSQR